MSQVWPVCKAACTDPHPSFPCQRLHACDGPIVYLLLHGEAPVMGRKPLGLPPHGTVHTRLPRPAQGTPHPGNLATFPNKTAWQSCSVIGAWEAVAGAVETTTPSFAGSSWPEPASYHLPSNSACRTS
eukprot:1142325-Pelagomonas_calceolata.AAC.1